MYFGCLKFSVPKSQLDCVFAELFEHLALILEVSLGNGIRLSVGQLVNRECDIRHWTCANVRWLTAMTHERLG